MGAQQLAHGPVRRPLTDVVRSDPRAAVATLVQGVERERRRARSRVLAQTRAGAVRARLLLAREQADVHRARQPRQQPEVEPLGDLDVLDVVALHALPGSVVAVEHLLPQSPTLVLHLGADSEVGSNEVEVLPVRAELRAHGAQEVDLTEGSRATETEARELPV